MQKYEYAPEVNLQTTQSQQRKTYQVGDNAWSGYDLSTFLGGLQFYREVCSPEKSFYSAETITEYLRDVKALVRDRANSEGEAQLTQEEFQEYRQKRIVLAASISRDTDKVLPWMMRTSSFIPISIPIVAGMVLCPPTQAFTIFWQIMNQSYMAGLNIGNANEASGRQGNGQLMKAYCMATGTAIGVACSLRVMTPYLLKGRTGGLAACMNYFIGYAAVASSSAINVYAMRKNEIETGVSVKDETTGEDLGLS